MRMNIHDHFSGRRLSLYSSLPLLVMFAACSGVGHDSGRDDNFQVGVGQEGPQTQDSSEELHDFTAETPRGKRSGKYRVIDGQAITEGDIVLGDVDADGKLISLNEQAAGSGYAAAGANLRWPPKLAGGGCRVPYVLTGFDSSVERVVRRALDHFNTMATGCYWEYKAPFDTDYVNFLYEANRNGGSSAVGRVGGAQDLKLGSNISEATVLHEMLHALGFWHEQSREDRTNYVEVLWLNISAGYASDFQKGSEQTPPQQVVSVGPYDYGSIMHYKNSAWGVYRNWDGTCPNGTPSGFPLKCTTIYAKNNADRDLGGDYLSAGDIAGVNSMYPIIQGTPMHELRVNAPSWQSCPRIEADGRVVPANCSGGTVAAQVFDESWAIIDQNTTWVMLRIGNRCLVPSDTSEVRAVACPSPAPDAADKLKARWAVTESNGKVMFRSGLNSRCLTAYDWDPGAPIRNPHILTAACGGTWDSWQWFSRLNAPPPPPPPPDPEPTCTSLRCAQAYAFGGDFGHDQLGDLLIPGAPGSNTIPIARSEGDGSFSVVNNATGFEPFLQTGATILTGDFDGDQHADVVATGVGWWLTIPIGFSRDGTFAITNLPSDFNLFTKQAGAKALAGDFNGDGMTDLAATGVNTWNTIPFALSKGDGKFREINASQAEFAALAAQTGVKAVAGDFDADGRSDILLTGGSGWTNVALATLTENDIVRIRKVNNDLHLYTGPAGVTIYPGDYNGDGKADLLMIGPASWNTVPVAFSNGSNFNITNLPSNFKAYASTAGAKLVTGDFNGDAKTDILATGVAAWNYAVVAFSNGDGTFNVTTQPSDLGNYTNQASARVYSASLR